MLLSFQSHQALFSQALNEDVASSDIRVDFQLTIDLLKLDIRYEKYHASRSIQKFSSTQFWIIRHTASL